MYEKIGERNESINIIHEVWWEYKKMYTIFMRNQTVNIIAEVMGDS